ncbi:MAG: DUF975 family protein [Oscillospiraceae bacterium]|nr:DUF975 family protein [Oscillospiraceae bacterium]MDY2863344.1 DUF975 family protein [Oscillospiraceae bacterium]
MWSISMLKENAKRMLSGYYWVALGASLIFMLLAGGLLGQYKSKTVDVNDYMNEYMNGSGYSVSDDYDFNSEEDIERYIEDYSSAGEAAGEDAAEEFEKIFEDAFGGIDTSDMDSLVSTVLGVMIVAFLIAFVVKFIYDLLFANPLTVGHNRFYLDARMGNAQVGNVFSQLSSGKYGNTVKTMFLYDLKLWLWGLFTVIPVIYFGVSFVNTISSAGNMSGSYDDIYSIIMQLLGSFMLALLLYCICIIPQIIKRLSYTMVPYLLAENPQMSQKRAFEISVNTMKGEKAHYFGLQLSFIGWYILAGLAGGIVGQFAGESLGSIVTIIGLVFLYPYVFATYAEFYCCMREKAMATGTASPDELCGVFGKAAQDVPFPGQDAANSMPYQRVDTGAASNGTYPAYPHNGAQNTQAPAQPAQSGVMDEIDTSALNEQPAPESKVSLEKPKADENDDYTGPEIK